MHPCFPAGLITALLVVPSAALAADEADRTRSPKPFDSLNSYVERDILGWSVLVHRELIEEHPGLSGRVLDHLRHQLHGIIHHLPADRVEELRTVRIWVEYNEPHHPCMAYHPDAGWLQRNAMHPAKAKCVEIANSENFLRWTVAQPWMVLHELAHAYHDQFLEDGFDNADLVAAHDRAMAENLYASVLHIHGGNRRHYAATNPMEYFAEATEAYFGTNDFFPFVRAELERHDPEGFKAVERIWRRGGE